MTAENPIFNVLVTSGNQAPLAVGGDLSTLAVGQLGVFNYHTNKAIDGTVAGDRQDIFIAVGLDAGDGSLGSINKSAGQMIQVRNAKSLTVREYMPNKPKIVEVGGFSARCESDYGIKIEFRNSKVYGMYGYNQFTKTFTYTSACCSDQCSACGTGDSIDLVTGLVNNINLDDDKLVTASYFVNVITTTLTGAASADGVLSYKIGSTAYTTNITNGDSVTTAAGKIVSSINNATNSPYYASNATGVISIYPKTSVSGNTKTLAVTTNVAGLTVGAPVLTNSNVTNTSTFSAANPGVGLAIRITSNPLAIQKYLGIDLQYQQNRATDIIVSLVEGFKCNGNVTIVQQLSQSQGDAYDIQHDEYIAAGWNGALPSVFRTSAITGMPNGGGLSYNAVTGAKYNTVVLTYEMDSIGGGQRYGQSHDTRIAIPCAESTTLGGLATILDAIFATRFGAISDDVTGFNCTNAAEIHTKNNYATDGIESIAN